MNRKYNPLSTDLPDRAPPQEDASLLADETQTMERRRREVEQSGHRKLARVHAKEHREEETQSLEGDLEQNPLQHPDLNTQRFDGIDPSINPEPPLNSEARREFDNQRREQEMEKQLRLGHMPKFGSTPRPEGP